MAKSQNAGRTPRKMPRKILGAPTSATHHTLGDWSCQETTTPTQARSSAVWSIVKGSKMLGDHQGKCPEGFSERRLPPRQTIRREIGRARRQQPRREHDQLLPGLQENQAKHGAKAEENAQKILGAPTPARNHTSADRSRQETATPSRARSRKLDLFFPLCSGSLAGLACGHVAPALGNPNEFWGCGRGSCIQFPQDLLSAPWKHV